MYFYDNLNTTIEKQIHQYIKRKDLSTERVGEWFRDIDLELIHLNHLELI